MQIRIFARATKQIRPNTKIPKLSQTQPTFPYKYLNQPFTQPPPLIQQPSPKYECKSITINQKSSRLKHPQRISRNILKR